MTISQTDPGLQPIGNERLNLESEFLGGLLAAPEIASDFTDIPPEAFGTSFYTNTWRAIRDLVADGQIPDLAAVALFLRERQQPVTPFDIQPSLARLAGGDRFLSRERLATLANLLRTGPRSPRDHALSTIRTILSSPASAPNSKTRASPPASPPPTGTSSRRPSAPSWTPPRTPPQPRKSRPSWPSAAPR